MPTKKICFFSRSKFQFSNIAESIPIESVSRRKVLISCQFAALEKDRRITTQGLHVDNARSEDRTSDGIPNSGVSPTFPQAFADGVTGSRALKGAGFSNLAGARRKSPATSSICAGYFSCSSTPPRKAAVIAMR